jgi:hypothetical protein
MSGENIRPIEDLTALRLSRTACVPIITALLVGIIHSLSPMLGLLCFVIGVIIIAIWAVILFARATVAASYAMWRRSGLLYLILIGVWPLVRVSPMAGDYIHLFAFYPFYRWQIDSVLNPPLKPISFSWGDTGFAGSANSHRELVYDSTGKLANDIGMRPWPDDPSVTISTSPLMGDFFVVQMSW